MRLLPPRPLRVAALIALTLASCAQLRNLPSLTDDQLLPPDLAQSSKIYAADGSLITTLHEEENRTVVGLRRVPRHVQRAVVAIEDERFYKHDGVDFRAVLRALVANATSGEIREGGSTITQQYVKNVIIAPGEIAEKTLARKLNEAALARQLEKEISKNEILERYLNTVYFGEGAYGIEAAAKTYFGKSAAQLTLSEGAMLAAVIRRPEDYDPYKHKQAGLERRNLVLDKMAELGWASPEQVARAKAKGLNLQQVARKDTYPAPYFVDYVQRLITYDPRFEAVGKNVAQRTQRLFTGGLKIHTTIDLDAQAAAEQAVREQLPNEGDPHASLVAIEPTTGHVRALVGGRDWFARPKEDPYSKVNLAILAEPGLGRVRDCNAEEYESRAPGCGRQGGSAFKPFALAAAIREGVPLSKLYKAQSCMDFPGANAGGNWHVCNYESTSFGDRLSLLEGTVMSVNVVYAQLILEIGPENVVEAAADMGINTNIAPVPSAVLGSSPVNPLGMASAYGTLATNGTHHPPVAITKIVDTARDKVLYDAEDDETLEPVQAIEPSVAYLTTTALQQVVQRGTGVRANIGRPSAGKTGTAQEYRDAWFVGYTPDLVASVWVGYPQGEIEMKPSCVGATNPCLPTRVVSGSGVTGGSFPALIWNSFMTDALAGVPPTPFDVPDIGLVHVVIDTRNGCLAGKFTPDEYRADAVFPAGTEPEHSCREPGDKVQIPDLFGFPVDDATRILEGSGFEVAVVREYSESYPPGRVIGQEPGAGQKALRGSTVTLYESSADPEHQGRNEGEEDDTATVPDVLGMTRGQAEAELKNAGFDVVVITEPEDQEGESKKNRGRVWKQSPPGGTEAESGSTVNIWVNPK